MNKKGNIDQLFPAVLAIVLVGVLITVGILIMSSFQNVSYLSTTTTSINESLTAANATAIQTNLTVGLTARNGVCGALSSVLNFSNFVIAPGNFTRTGCAVVNSSGMDIYGTGPWKYTYTYTFDNATAATTALISGNTTIATIATTWLPIIIVVLAAGIVLAILLGAFGGKRK